MSRVAGVDAHSLIFRAFHASTARDGAQAQPVSAFRSLLVHVLDRLAPDYVVVAADSPGPCFRSQLDPDYKAHRAPAPEGLPEMLQESLDLLRTSGLPVYQHPDFEADDILATLASRVRPGHELVVVSSDRDLAALVAAQVHLMLLRTGRHVLYTPDNVRELFGVPAQQIADYKALVGDKADNIPGVPGIGPKGALALLEAYPDVHQLIDALPGLEGRHAALCRDHLEALERSYHLAVLRADAPVELDPDAARWTPEKREAVLRR